MENVGYGGRSYRFLAAANGSSLGAGNFVIADATAGFSRLVIDPNGYVGIGTTSPADRLDIVGGNMAVYSNNAAAGTNLKVGFGTKTYALLRTTADVDGATSLQSVSNSSTFGALLLNAQGGNVGVGTSAPASRFHVIGSGNTADAVNTIGDQSMTIQANTGSRNQNAGAQLEFAIPANTDGSNLFGQGRIITVAGTATNADATGKMILGTRRNFNKLGTGNQWYYGNDLVIDGAGRVGISTINPAAFLDVGKPMDAQLSSVLGRLSEGNATGNGTFLGVKNYYSQLNGIYSTLSDVKSFAIEHNFGGQTNSSVSFLRGPGWTGGGISISTGTNLERVRITGDGYVGIGTSTPASKLHMITSGNSIDGYTPLSAQSMIVQANTNGRNSAAGAQLEFAIPANTDGTNSYGQGRIITVAGNSNDQDPTGKMMFGTRRYFDKVGSGNQWYYGNDLVIDGTGRIGVGAVNPSALLHVSQTKTADGTYVVQRWDTPSTNYNLQLKQNVVSGVTSWSLDPLSSPEIG
ncbi:hypothetical protein [Mucilaginibacter glaciei]|uniref:Uncharacterized protein n=1 Tax=Mucilaginibacter glaciei TaxID=2772109 RepID=A0A926NMJ2_9SPHI|nr:hypothetical protein [Mucilaginibacter glaciei]MBD1394844.1 hypothetical protein [Mucilaginibacter glaciei]